MVTAVHNRRDNLRKSAAAISHNGHHMVKYLTPVAFQ
jgi:hypothetical protein